MTAAMPHLLYTGRFAAARDCPWHAHDGHELVFVTKGACIISCGGIELECTPGTLAILPLGEPQYQKTSGMTHTSYVVWQGGDAWLAPKARTCRVALDARIARWIGDLCDLGGKPQGDARIADALLQAVLAGIAEVEHAQMHAAALHPALAEAIRLLTADLAAPLDVCRLARRVGLSGSQLARLFRQHHGSPPLRYQHGLRLRLAERLLHDPRLSVAEVGKRCGWPELNHFVRVFGKHAGVSPGVWRGTRRSTKG